MTKEAHWVVHDMKAYQIQMALGGQANAFLPQSIPLPTRRTKEMKTDRGGDLSRYPSQRDWRSRGEKALCFGCAQVGHSMKKCPRPYLMESDFHVQNMYDQIIGTSFAYFCRGAQIEESRWIRYIHPKLKDCKKCVEKKHTSGQCLEETKLFDQEKRKKKHWFVSSLYVASQKPPKSFHEEQESRNDNVERREEEEAVATDIEEDTEQVDQAMDLTQRPTIESKMRRTDSFSFPRWNPTTEKTVSIKQGAIKDNPILISDEDSVELDIEEKTTDGEENEAEYEEIIYDKADSQAGSARGDNDETSDQQEN
jgi:hypothetical protein